MYAVGWNILLGFISIIQTIQSSSTNQNGIASAVMFLHIIVSTMELYNLFSIIITVTSLLIIINFMHPFSVSC